MHAHVALSRSLSDIRWLIIIVPGLMVGAGMALMVVLLIIKWGLLGRQRPGRYAMGSWAFIAWIASRNALAQVGAAMSNSGCC